MHQRELVLESVHDLIVVPGKAKDVLGRDGEGKRSLIGRLGDDISVAHAVASIRRITKKKGIFEKEYTTCSTPRWTEEVFTIVQALATQSPTYRLKDFNGEEIFYEPELRRTDIDVYRIEKVLRRRTRGGVKEAYVKWRGYPATFHSWIKESDSQ